MATLTKGTTFTSGDVVTPDKLNNLVDQATSTLENSEVTTAKIADANVTTAKIADANVTTAKIADANVTTAKIADGAVTNAKLGNDIILVPAGAVMPFAMNSAPTGWLPANGAEYEKTGTYAALFAAIGTTHGETNGSGGAGTSHFRVPDLRGYFIRGFGTNSDGTASAAFGAKQTDELIAHRHFISNNDSIADVSISQTNYMARVGSTTGSSGQNYFLRGSATEPTLALTSSTGGTETRPRNIALLYCIKF